MDETKDREQTRAEGLAYQVARLSHRELEQFGDAFHKAQREREMTQTTPVNEKAMSGNMVAGAAMSPGLEGYSSQEIDLRNVEDAMTYQPWHPGQQECGNRVKDALLFAAKTILREVPRSPRRTLAIQHLINARMDANMAISFGGRF